jgi:hypothetical protein
MNPTKYYSFTGSLAAHALLLIMFIDTNASAVEAAPQMTEDGNGGYVLNELVIRRQAKVENVNLENDGSFSLLSSSPSVVYSALNSGSGAAVNFELSFARHSTVMTADGQQNMDIIARALKLIGSESAFKLEIHRFGNQDPSGRKKLTQSRANAIVSKFRNAYRITSEITVDYEAKSIVASSKEAESKTVDRLGVTVVNLGENVAVKPLEVSTN